MNLSFLNYFFGYIFKSKTRQKLIFLAIIGLLISSFSLTVLQGVMGGLQNGLVTRSKNVLGTGYLDLGDMNQRDEEYSELIDALNKNKINFLPELELELMVQHDKYVSPIIIHGFDYSQNSPGFLKGKETGHLVIGGDLGREIRTYYGAKVKITSPAHVGMLLQEIPRQTTTYISDYFSSELPEVDGIHGWVDIKILQNLIRSYSVNKIRIFETPIDKVSELIAAGLLPKTKVVSWEEQNNTLVWALNLETRVMLFLFIGMSFLIGVCITSGFLIFYNKIKVDLASFWILGLSKKKILNLIYSFGQGLTVSFCLAGVLLGYAFLLLLETNSFLIMPDYFVERNLPVKIELFQIVIAFIVPYIVASIFTHFTFRVFRKDNFSFISLIKKVG